MRKTARFTFTAMSLCAFAGALVMLTLCARAWASDTFVWTDPTGKTPGQVNVTVIVGNSTYYYIVKNVSFPTVQELIFNFDEAPLVGPSNPFTVPPGFVLQDVSDNQVTVIGEIRQDRRPFLRLQHRERKLARLARKLILAAWL